MNIDVEMVQRWANTVGVVTLLVITLLGGARQWWVFGWQYREVVKDRDEWRTLALRGAGIAERLVDKAVAPNLQPPQA